MLLSGLRRRLVRRRCADDGADVGAAVIDFVLLSILLLVLLFAVLQVAVYFYARNVAAASAADAARYAAGADVSVGSGRGRAEHLIYEGLDDADAGAITCTSVLTRDHESGLQVATVHCHGRLRVGFSALASPLPPIDVTSSVLREHRP